MKVLVTGATGFIGRNLIRRLVEEGFEVISTGRSLYKLGPLLNKTKALYLDIRDKQAVRKIIREERPEAVFHCAAVVENHPLKRLWRVNVKGTENILGACLKEEVGKVIYLSSVAVISGNPQVPLTEDLPYVATNQYGESKIEAEKAALEYRKKGLRVAILRPCMVYGEDEPHALSLLVNLIKWRLIPILGKGNNKLHLVDVENVVDVMIISLAKEEAYEGSYLIADKEALGVNEVFGYIAQILKVRPPLHIPENFIPLFTHLPFAGKKFSIFIKDREYSIRRLEERLGYTPRVSVYEGLKRAVLSLV